MQEILVFETPDQLPAELRKALVGDNEDLDDFLDDLDEDAIGERLYAAQLSGWLVKLSTPVRSFSYNDDQMYQGSWGYSSSRWFYCAELPDLLPQARAWIAEMIGKWEAAREVPHG